MTSDGQPKGIGLSAWRFCVGAGTAGQAQSGIKDDWRRAECFMDPDGSYHWDRQAGEVWFLKAARDRGVKQFIAFVNSPPVQLTANGKGFATNGQCNLPPARYDAYAIYLARVIAGVRDLTGITFNYVSPVNEPQWDWSGGKQEGCPYDNTQIAGMVRSLSRALVQHVLPTRILIPEAAQLHSLCEVTDKPATGNEIDAFFQSGSDAFIGDLPNLARIAAAHSYFTTSPQSEAVEIRQKLAGKIAEFPAMHYWETEYCVLGANHGEIAGPGRDLGMDTALYVARVIHDDLAIGDAAAWQWWLGISCGDYKDGLIYIDKDKKDGAFHDSKILWALGNYSRFVVPGSVRLNASGSGDDLFVSAYRTPESHLVTVALNSSPNEKKLALKFEHFEATNLTTYTTSSGSNLRPEKATNIVTLPPRSVVTIVGRFTEKEMQGARG